MPSLFTGHTQCDRVFSRIRQAIIAMAVVVFANVSVSPAQDVRAQLGLSRQMWFAVRTDGLPGIGTATDPFDGSADRLDAKLRELFETGATNLHLHLLAGVYETMGTRSWRLRGGWKLQGDGIDRTIVRFVNATNNVIAAVIGNYATDGQNNIEVCDLTVDCNHSATNPNLAHAVAIGGSGHAIRRVKAINASGLADVRENFIIAIDAGTGNSEGNIIEECEIIDFKGSWCTAIGLSSPGLPDRFISGIVRANKVYDLRNPAARSALTAFGGGGMKNVLFENNYCLRCDIGVNIDTAKSLNLTFKGNQFNCRGRGISLIGQYLDTVVIEDNVIDMEPTRSDYAVYCYDLNGQARLKNFIIRNNIIRGIKGRSGMSGGLAVSVADGESFIISGNRIDAGLRSLVSGTSMACFDNTDLQGRPMNLISGFAAQSDQINLPLGERGTLLLNKGNAYVIPDTTRDSLSNGTNLLNAYSRAKSMRPHNQPLSNSNRATVFLFPGTYAVTDSSLNLNTPFVDLIGLGNAGATRIESEGSALVQTADNVQIENLTLQCSWPGPGTDKAAYSPADGLSQTSIRNCIFSGMRNGLSMRLGVNYTGYYENCQADAFSFGSGRFGGTAKNCTAGPNSFGGSGVLIGCQVAGAIGSAFPTTGKLTDCRIGPVADNMPCIVLGEGASLYNCSLIANPTGTAYSIDAVSPVRARIAHCRFNHGMRNISNLIAQPANVDDPGLD